MQLTKSHFGMLRAMVAHFLDRPMEYKWSLQGFGMLRLHISDEVRLNIWDSRFRVPNVSMTHTHPWDFVSVVISGRLLNVKLDYAGPENGGKAMLRSLIKPGPGGGLRSESDRVFLKEYTHQWVGKEYSYVQAHNEIHISLPEDGCITLNYRTRVGPDEAYVFWYEGEKWVSAEPRPATEKEVLTIIENARKVMGSGA